MKRLLVVSNMYPSKTAPYFGVFVERQVNALRSLGVECELAVSTEYAAGSGQAALKKYAGLTLEACRKASSFHPDAILAHFAFPTGGIALASRMFIAHHVPIALVAHGGDVDPNARRSFVLDRATRAVVRNVDVLVAVSKSIAQEARLLGVRQERIVIASMGYDQTIFKPGSKKDARAALGLDPQRRIAVVVGNVIKRKGIHTILEAAPSMDAVQWIVVGDGDLDSWRAKGASLGDAVRFAGPAAPHEVVRWLQAADVAAVPSLREPLGVAALEALACGTPVVASNTGGLAEIIDHEQTGLLVEPGNANALAASVMRVLEDTQLAQKFSEAGIAAAAAHTCEAQARRLLAAIQSAAAWEVH